jgi:lipopolysaccharide export LptBFGC system permease protein LptF
MWWIDKNVARELATIVGAVLIALLIVFLVIASHEIFYGDWAKLFCQETPRASVNK